MIFFSFFIANFYSNVISIQFFFWPILLSININSLVGKPLVLINQSFTLLTNFSTELKKQISIMIWNKI